MDALTLHFEILSVFMARFLAMLSLAPVYSSGNITFFHRFSFAFIFALLLVPVVELPPQFYHALDSRYFILIMEQAFIGFLIGSIINFIFVAYQMAGEFFSIQMGFGITEVFDPMSQVSLPLMGTLKNAIAILVFFASGAYILLIEGVAFSLEKIPMLGSSFLHDVSVLQGVLDFIIFFASSMFLVALKIALPIIGTLLLTSIALGILSKTAPQMNMLMLGFPVKIVVAFIVIAAIAPFVIESMHNQFYNFFDHWDSMIRQWPQKM